MDRPPWISVTFCLYRVISKMSQILQGLIFCSKIDDEHKQDEDRDRDVDDAEVVHSEELHTLVFLLKC